MMHDHPSSTAAVVIGDEMPPLHNQPGKSGLGKVVIALIGISLTVAALVTALDWQSVIESLSPNKAVAVSTPVLTPEQIALTEATQQDQTQVAAKGEAAAALNAAMPVGNGPIEAAQPFYLTENNMTNAEKALRCMTQAVYYEAGFEPMAGRYAVAQVILNRMRHPAFPKSVCGVIYQGSSKPGCQFSFACDGSLLRAPSPKAWAEARQVAEQVLAGTVTSAVGMATHYHANYVSPYWAPKLHKITQMGAHIFYRWPGNWGRRVAFNGVYRGGEYIPATSSLANINASTDFVTEAELGVDSAAPVVKHVSDRRADNDVGGRIDTTKTWRLTIPMGPETRAKADVPANMQISALEATQ
ncbi:cell wall hydrolase [Sphingorhabdus sp.]|uniref:cell wall hydrolase n=1 Tax=Sphingorhabdus sp. TaxID=1902408 RepID=UPI00391AA68F